MSIISLKNILNNIVLELKQLFAEILNFTLSIHYLSGLYLCVGSLVVIVVELQTLQSPCDTKLLGFKFCRKYQFPGNCEYSFLTSTNHYDT